jgi:hypothetical protein
VFGAALDLGYFVERRSSTTSTTPTASRAKKSSDPWRASSRSTMRNLVVPVVGDFGGPKAIRLIGQYVKDHDGTVATFYLSNVEQFLGQNGTWTNFCASVATLPLDETSTYIYSGRGAPNSRQYAGFGGGLQTTIRPILSEVTNCPGGGSR